MPEAVQHAQRMLQVEEHRQTADGERHNRTYAGGELHGLALAGQGENALHQEDAAGEAIKEGVLAQSREVALSEDELSAISEAAAEYYASLSKEENTYLDYL